MKKPQNYLCLLILVLLVMPDVFAQSQGAISSPGALSNSVLPKPDEYDKCYARAELPDQYEWVDKKVMVKEGYFDVLEIPAVYDTITEKVLVKEETVEYVTIPAEYKNITQKVLIKEASQVLKERYENVVDTVKVKEEYGEWVQAGKDPNCFSKNPEDCYIMHYKKVPAEFEMTSKKVLTQVGDYTSEEIPPEYRTISKRVLVRPAKVVEKRIPAQYKNVKKKILVNPAKREEVWMPPKYETEKERRLMSKGGQVEWVEILCPHKVKAKVVRQIQLALYGKGYKVGALDGRLDGLMRSALLKFQEQKGLPMGNINRNTLEALGLNMIQLQEDNPFEEKANN